MGVGQHRFIKLICQFQLNCTLVEPVCAACHTLQHWLVYCTHVYSTTNKPTYTGIFSVSIYFCCRAAPHIPFPTLPWICRRPWRAPRPGLKRAPLKISYRRPRCLFLHTLCNSIAAAFRIVCIFGCLDSLMYDISDYSSSKHDIIIEYTLVYYVHLYSMLELVQVS